MLLTLVSNEDTIAVNEIFRPGMFLGVANDGAKEFETQLFKHCDMFIFIALLKGLFERLSLTRARV